MNIILEFIKLKLLNKKAEVNKMDKLIKNFKEIKFNFTNILKLYL
jgi:hypothetical protein